jgi:NAD(P)-dependent dehydrogenase (short-subunit alcohol dehydrogenase family)
MRPGAGAGSGLSLAGRVAVVSGGGGGIGLAVVRALIEAGAQVASIDLPGVACPAGAHGLACDLGVPDAIPELMTRFRARCGRLDVLVHCAGIRRDAVLWKMHPGDWTEVLRVNLDSAFHLLRAAVPVMRERAQGAVVLIASINGERGKFGQANYAASKAGLIGLGRSAARELGKFGIRVNVVAPGWIETPMTDSLPDRFRDEAVAETALGRIGRPEDVAGAVLFLCSDLSAHVTGQVLRVDGGQLMA